MDNLLFNTLICWQSRNWRHKKQAIEFCKNYGLKPLLNNVYLGKLTARERKIFVDNLTKLFAKRTEKLNIFPLCKSCFANSEIQGIIKESLSNPSFEIVG